jgi:hypothetical protein
MTQVKFNKKLTDIAQEGFDASAAEKTVAEATVAPPAIEENKEPSIPFSQLQEFIDKALEKKDQEFEERMKSFSIQANPELKKSEEPKPKKVETSDILPEFENWEYRDRIYVLCTGFSSLSHGIRDRHKKNSALMYKGRSLRFSTSQASFFMDEQKGDVLTCYLSIQEGKLFVEKENSHLQKFLAIHPDNGIVFKEHNPKEEAKLAYDTQNKKLDAHFLSREIETASLEAIATLMCKDYLESWDIYTVKKQLYLEIEANPDLFIKLANDKSLKYKSIGKTAVFRGLLRYDNFRFTDEKDNLVCESGRNELDPYGALATYFSTTSEGRNLYEYLIRKIEQ